MPDITREAVERLSKIYLAKVRYHRTKNPYYKEPSQSQITSDTLLAMADRIEELEAKLATCEKYKAAYAECDRIGTQAVRDLEDKLQKAVQALTELVKDCEAEYPPSHGAIKYFCRTTLTELNYDERSEKKGEADA